jgi:hypothetical protein
MWTLFWQASNHIVLVRSRARTALIAFSCPTNTASRKIAAFPLKSIELEHKSGLAPTQATRLESHDLQPDIALFYFISSLGWYVGPSQFSIISLLIYAVVELAGCYRVQLVCS